MTMLNATFMPTGVEALVMVIAGAGRLARLWRTCHLHIKILFIELTEQRQVPLSLTNFLTKDSANSTMSAIYSLTACLYE